MPTFGKWLRAFGRFWWQFLVGDTPEVAVGVLGLVGLSFALRHHRVAAVIGIPLLCGLLLALSTWRGRRRRARASDPSELPHHP